VPGTVVIAFRERIRLNLLSRLGGGEAVTLGDEVEVILLLHICWAFLVGGHRLGSQTLGKGAK